MRCSSCGYELATTAKFCSNCGARVPATTDVAVTQRIGSVSGAVTGVTAGQDRLAPGTTVQTDQQIDTVAAGGAVAGVVIGGAAPVHVGGQQHYGDTVQGDKITGDQITVGPITGSTGVAIGAGAHSTVRTSQTGEDTAEADGTTEPFDRVTALRRLLGKLEEVLRGVEPAQAHDAAAVSELATVLVVQATQAAPNRHLVRAYADGLRRAVESLPVVAPLAVQLADRAEQDG